MSTILSRKASLLEAISAVYKSFVIVGSSVNPAPATMKTLPKQGSFWMVLSLKSQQPLMPTHLRHIN